MKIKKQVRVGTLWKFRPEGMSEEAQLMAFEKEKPNLLVIPESNNPADHEALLVMKGRGKVGYINADDKRWLMPAIKNSNRGCLIEFDHVVRANDEGSALLKYAIEVEPTDVAPLQPSQCWDDFSYTYPLIDDVAEIDTLNYAFNELLSIIKGNDDGVMQPADCVQLICDNCKYDMSTETTQLINDCCFELEIQGNKNMVRLQEHLERASTHRRSRVGEMEYEEWFNKLVSGALARKQLKLYLNEICKKQHSSSVSNEQMNSDLNQIYLQLLNMPFTLSLYIDSPAKLMHMAFYKNINRIKQKELLSALVLRQSLKKELNVNTSPTPACLPEENKEQALPAEFVMCFNDRQYAEEFMLAIRGMKNTQKTALVHRYVSEKKISKENCHRPLWKALHDMGLYAPSESNWNMQV